MPTAVAAIALAAGYWLGYRDSADAPPELSVTPATSPAGGSFGSPPPLTGSLRDQADRLFERIMQARARGDTAEVRFFLPMAIQAYEGAGALDADGLLHLGLLQLSANRAQAAAATARRIAEIEPGHLFGLALAGQAALAAGDEQAARAAFAEFLARYDEELARDRPEYDLHAPALQEYRTRALEITGD